MITIDIKENNDFDYAMCEVHFTFLQKYCPNACVCYGSRICTCACTNASATLDVDGDAFRFIHGYGHAHVHGHEHAHGHEDKYSYENIIQNYIFKIPKHLKQLFFNNITNIETNIQTNIQILFPKKLYFFHSISSFHASNCYKIRTLGKYLSKIKIHNDTNQFRYRIAGNSYIMPAIICKIPKYVKYLHIGSIHRPRNGYPKNLHTFITAHVSELHGVLPKKLCRLSFVVIDQRVALPIGLKMVELRNKAIMKCTGTKKFIMPDHINAFLSHGPRQDELENAPCCLKYLRVDDIGYLGNDIIPNKLTHIEIHDNYTDGKMRVLKGYCGKTCQTHVGSRVFAIYEQK